MQKEMLVICKKPKCNDFAVYSSIYSGQKAIDISILKIIESSWTKSSLDVS